MSDSSFAMSAEIEVSPRSLRRKGTPGLIADELRSRILAGELRPGTRITVNTMSSDLGVSANAMREALQLLERERLVTQHLNRGIFVSKLTASDIRDVYKLRRIVELGALAIAEQPSPRVLNSMRTAVELGERALREQDWVAAGQSTTAFHRELVSLTESERATSVMAQVMGELGLLMTNLQLFPEFHEHFVNRRRRIYEHIARLEYEAASECLSGYLDDGERVLLELVDKA